MDGQANTCSSCLSIGAVIFIHDTVLESLMCGDTQISSSELRKTIERLSVRDEQTRQENGS